MVVRGPSTDLLVEIQELFSVPLHYIVICRTDIPLYGNGKEKEGELVELLFKPFSD